MRIRPLAVVFVLFAAALTPSASLRAEVRLPSIFADHMVLQRDTAVPVWGWADAGEQVTVRIASQQKTTTADASGKWSISLDRLAAGGPHELTVQGTNSTHISDVLVGEVWVCSGQSNMAMTVARSANADSEIAAGDFPRIRMFIVERTPATEPQQDCPAAWQVCSPQTVGNFSAAAYYFGRKLHQELDVPIGLLNTSWGGTPVEAWTSLPAQAAQAQLRPVVAKWEQDVANYDPATARRRYEQQLASWKKRAATAKAAGGRVPRRPAAPANPRLSQHHPGNLYNGMVAPLAPYALRGGIWYQGESNAGRGQSQLYGRQLATLIADWRKAWGQGDFDFLWVQLPNFHAPQQEPVESTGWVLVREGMLKTLSVPRTGMAITVDIGEANNIHPKNKQDVGARLARWALAKTYGRDIVAAGPIYRSMQKRGKRVVLTFDYAGDGLGGRGGEAIRGFAIAGADGKFVPAEAEVRGNRVRVGSPDVEDPQAVRYAWADNPSANLVNSEGLPASPFRTDDWEIKLAATRR